MMALMLYVILLLNFFCNVEHSFVQGLKPPVSKIKAEEICIRSGQKLVTYKDIQENPSNPEYVSYLVNGESAWIEGYANFSSFMAWSGCFRTQSAGINSFNIPERSLFLCAKKCVLRNKSTSKATTYIGVNDKVCYCITDEQREKKLSNLAEKDRLCNKSCSNSTIDSCGGDGYMSVYRIIEDTKIIWGKEEPTARQCVYARKKDGRFEGYTFSCHTIMGLIIRGHICTQSAASSLKKETCSRIQSGICIIDGASSRQESFDDCLAKNGILAGLFGERYAISLLDDNLKYWLSVYRTFEPSENNRVGMVCLAVTKVHDTLYLDPDNCESQKSYLCKETDIPTPQESTIVSVDTSSVDRTAETTSSVDRTAETKDKNEDPDTKEESPLAYTVPTISLLAFFILVVVFVAYIRRRKRKTKSQSLYDEMYEADNVKNKLTTSSVSSEPGLNADSKCLIAKSKPDKPLRQTLKRRTQEIDYENFELKDKRNEELRDKTKNVETDQNKEYDKIEFKRKKNERKVIYEESKVYHHVVDGNGDNYDTVKSTKSCHSRDKFDNSYSRMNDGLIVDEYCDLASPLNYQNNCIMEKKDDFVQKEQQSE